MTIKGDNLYFEKNSDYSDIGKPDNDLHASNGSLRNYYYGRFGGPLPSEESKEYWKEFDKKKRLQRERTFFGKIYNRLFN